jgi:hypothetical protein
MSPARRTLLAGRHQKMHDRFHDALPERVALARPRTRAGVERPARLGGAGMAPHRVPVSRGARSAALGDRWPAAGSRARCPAAFSDLNLRLAELLDELRMPASLLAPVLAAATLELVDTADARDADDRQALLDVVHALRPERVEQYLALLTTDGPLVPVAAPVTGGRDEGLGRHGAAATALSMALGAGQAPTLRITSPTPDAIVSGATHIEAVDRTAVPGRVGGLFGQRPAGVHRRAAAVPVPVGSGARAPASHPRRGRLGSGRSLVANVRTKDVGHTERSRVDAVLVPVIVTDRGRFVRGLKQAGLRGVRGWRPQPIARLVSEESPLDLVMAIDVSGSMENALDDVKVAVKQFLAKLRPGDAATLVGFNDNMFIAAERETDPVVRDAAVDLLASWGGTAIYDTTVRVLDMVGERRPQRRGDLLRRGRSEQHDDARGGDGARAVERRHALHDRLRRRRDEAVSAQQPRRVRALHRRPGVLSPPDPGAGRHLRRDRHGAGEPVRALVFSTNLEAGRQRGGNISVKVRKGRFDVRARRGYRPQAPQPRARRWVMRKPSGSIGPRRQSRRSWPAGCASSPSSPTRGRNPRSAAASSSSRSTSTSSIGTGSRCAGLGPSDFVVTVDGQPRRVVSAEFVDVAAAKSQFADRPDASCRSAPTRGRASDGSSCSSWTRTRWIPAARSRSPGPPRPSFSQLTFADRTALVMLPVGTNISFTWSHDRVREALQHVAGMSASTLGGSTAASPRRVTSLNQNLSALRTVGQRECGSASAFWRPAEAAHRHRDRAALGGGTPGAAEPAHPRAAVAPASLAGRTRARNQRGERGWMPACVTSGCRRKRPGGSRT